MKARRLPRWPGPFTACCVSAHVRPEGNGVEIKGTIICRYASRRLAVWLLRVAAANEARRKR